MPWGKNKGTLVINLVTYTSYDIDNNKIIDNGKYEPTYGMIIVKNKNNEIVFNSKRKYNNSLSNFYINDLPYGEYKVKIIYSQEKLDNKWHTVILNNSLVYKSIVLQWNPVYRSEVYIEKNEIMPSFNRMGGASEIIGRGRTRCKLFEDNNLIIDEPSFYSALNFVVWGNNFVLEYASSVTLPKCEITPCFLKGAVNWTGDFFDTGIQAPNGTDYEIPIYSELWEPPEEVNPNSYIWAVNINDVGYSNANTGVYGIRAGKNAQEFGCRPHYWYKPEIYGDDDYAITIKDLFNENKSRYFERYFGEKQSVEYNGDENYFLNNIIAILYKNSTISTGVSVDFAYTTNQYEEKIDYYGENNIIKTIEIPKKTNIPYLEKVPEIVQNTKIYHNYKNYLKFSDSSYNFVSQVSGKKIRIISNQFTDDEIIFVNDTTELYYMIPQKEDKSECIFIQAIVCPNYSDDYDQY